MSLGAFSEPSLTCIVASAAFSASIFVGTMALAATEAIMEKNVGRTSLLCVERLNGYLFIPAGSEP